MAHEIHFPAEFSSNPNQTHLSMLINVFRIFRKSQVGEFDQGCTAKKWLILLSIFVLFLVKIYIFLNQDTFTR